MQESCEYRLKLPGNPDADASFALLDALLDALRKIASNGLKIFGSRPITVD
jgi:hypothetical protein